ncbi:ferredoxin reductase [Leptospira sp. GIMC2001]|uniref:ferredoxin reductase n=1 Tax=Leptospira sp. GIMC2001 TaxID=1513297 RepID=UPI00234B99AE|nr:ferredoxin reductase [Leptospira sp. GIMC2001]WCL50128.1 ferredoxin reductase [Leptospira sp. GIMC2001]
MSKTNTVYQKTFNQFTQFVDMFAYPLRFSHYLELINPLWTKHALQAKVVKVWDETKDSRTITLKPGRGWRNHRAGQFIRVGVPIGGMRHTRTYSISSAPGSKDGCISITVKAIDNGRVSHHLVRDLKVGSFLPIGDPQGEFVLPDAIPVHPLFITAGSGITPVMAMLRNYSKEFRVLPDISHIHYAPHAYDVIFGKELDNLSKNQKNYNLTRIYTRELGEKTSKKLHFNPEQLETICPDWRDREVWACGPASLLDSLEEHWAKAGLSRNLHTERFRAKLAETPTGSILSGKVNFTKSEIDYDTDGVTNLLRVAEDAGLNPAHGCRMGICHGCDCKLVSGSVRDLRNGSITSEPGQNIQICVSASIGDVEVEL